MLPIFSNIRKVEPTLAEKKVSVERLIEDSSPTGGFYLMLLCATVIVTVGLIIGNATIIIGGMLVSPLLAPILSLALGVAMGDKRLVLRSFWIVMITSGFVYLVTLFLGIFVPFDSVNIEIVSRIKTSLAYVMVALFAGVAATVSYVKPQLSAALPGVAIAIALLPPLSVSALGLVLLDGEVFFGAFSLYVVNLVGIILASVVVFAMFGYYPLRKNVHHELRQEANASSGPKGEKKSA